jgi:hypothetical protein
VTANVTSITQQFVTISTLYAGSTTATSTALPTAPGQAGTVFVQVPRQYTTISTLYTGTVISIVTVLTPTSVGQTGQVVVQIPSPSTSVSSTISLGRTITDDIPLTL